MRALEWFLRPGGMTCTQVRNLVQSYLDGELDEHQAAKLAAHLHRCRRCGVEAETYRQIKASLASPPPAASVERVRQFAYRLVPPGDDG